MSSCSWKKIQCIADEKFHFAINKWDVTKQQQQQQNKQEETEKKQTNNNNKTKKDEQSLENSLNKLYLKKQNIVR